MAVNFTLSITLQAAAEIQNIAEWYESKAPYLGSPFLEAVDGGLKNIVQQPLAFATHKRTSLRRYRLHYFPYRIFYLAEESIIKVIDIIHNARSDKYLRNRLK